jgi:hypothetical protein
MGKGEPSVNLKCDPERAQELRAQFDDIKPGWHMSKIWNTVAINKEVPDPLVKELLTIPMSWFTKFNQENAGRNPEKLNHSSTLYCYSTIAILHLSKTP